MLNPIKTRFNKQHKIKMKGLSLRGNNICFGEYALQALESVCITSKQIESGIKEISKNMHIKIWIRIFPDKPVFIKSTEKRTWVFIIKPGKIIYEIMGLSEILAKKYIRMAANKLPIKTRFIKKK
uniref:50S ribosomal protein L16, chloroplastic n=1 Tax=Sciaphila thaidanica TaxID=2161793 RepID=A0A2R4PAJ6_9LILI|nr:ribosomal protein L16 [Sciaphila thaidanica]